MHSLLSPGIRLLGRFGFARKFQILFFLFMLPLAGSLWMIAQEYRTKLTVISNEQSGVRELLALDALDAQLPAQRNLAARWKAADILHDQTPAAKAAMTAVDTNFPLILQSVQALGESAREPGGGQGGPVLAPRGPPWWRWWKCCLRGWRGRRRSCRW